MVLKIIQSCHDHELCNEGDHDFVGPMYLAFTKVAAFTCTKCGSIGLEADAFDAPEPAKPVELAAVRRMKFRK